MAINQTESQRRARLNSQFEHLEGWDNERILEKETDAQRIADKLEVQIDNITLNTSPIALSNMEILELYVKVAEFLQTLDAEIAQRQ